MSALTGVLALVLAAPAEEVGRHEAENLEGNWRVVSVEVDGAKLPADQVRGFTLNLKAGRFVSDMGEQKQTGTYSVDASANPKRFDIVPADGPDKGKTRPMVYSLDGNVLRLCGSEIGTERPADFETKNRHGVILMVLRRD